MKWSRLVAGKPLEKDGTSWESPNETGISRYEGFLHCVRKRPHSGEGGGQGGGFKRNEKVCERGHWGDI